MKQFIDGLALPEEEKARLKAMTPANYIGRAITMVDELNSFKQFRMAMLSGPERLSGVHFFPWFI